MTTAKYLFAKLQTRDLLVEQGRLLYAVLYAFSSAGYRISLFDNLDPESLGRCGKLVPSIPNVTLTTAPPGNPEDYIYLYDKEDRGLGKRSWRKKLKVKDDLFSSYCFKSPIVVPYGIHPRQTGPDLDERLAQHRDRERKMRIFFSGDTKNYGRNRIQYPAPKLPRLEVINTILERLGDAVTRVADSATLNMLRDAGYTNKCVIVDTSQIWVEEREWLGSLARADFFLSPPGIVMPMCHNIIEAMAVGTIPITNYPEWLEPRLSHMENCIVFDDKDDLINKIRSVLEMDSTEIARMRANVVSYYENHLKPSVLARELEARPERENVALVYTEGNVARNSAKLNANSILLRESATAKQPGWKCIFGSIVR